mmetsp:Transcript_99164/g.145024  ORF Transcript_99164/g.145024 Transcript_99164/m.145024 type:complete len:103 (-) Transcript_99164:441-749(-)
MNGAAVGSTQPNLRSTSPATPFYTLSYRGIIIALILRIANPFRTPPLLFLAYCGPPPLPTVSTKTLNATLNAHSVNTCTCRSTNDASLCCAVVRDVSVCVSA